jgi:transcriptional regulator GlxA family with amidase domain
MSRTRSSSTSPSSRACTRPPFCRAGTTCHRNQAGPHPDNFPPAENSALRAHYDAVSLGIEHYCRSSSDPFELACVCEVFGARRRPEIGRELYRFRVVTSKRRVAVRDAMFTIGDAGDLGDIDDAHTVFVPNRPDTDTPTHPAVIKAVQRAHRRGARLVGLCTGAYTLAEAGLLDGRPAAVHWQLADDFRRRHPTVDLQPDVLFIDDGDILTS